MKQLVIFITILFSILSNTSNAIASDDQKIKLLVLGDSLSAAYGIQSPEGWVSLLGEKYKDTLHIYNASISGETTDGGLQTLPRHLAYIAPDIAIIELGANDGLRGFPLKLIKDNLQTLINLSKSANTQVILVGNHLPPNYGKRYSEGFFSIYSQLAQEQQLLYVPFMLEGIAQHQDLMQEDGLHPNAKAQSKILSIIQPSVDRAIRNIAANGTTSKLP